MQLSALRRMSTVAEVEATVGPPPAVIMMKQISALDEGCRSILAHSPLAAFGYRDAEGVSRTTFLGGTPGFIRVHSPTRISFALPDGQAHGPVSFLFLLPGVGETLRVNGSVVKRKGAETFVDVHEAYVHCAQAVIRSRLWQPPAPTDPAPVPDFEPANDGGGSDGNSANGGDDGGGNGNDANGDSDSAGTSGDNGNGTSGDSASNANGGGDDGPLRGPGVADFLAAAPFLALSTWDASGGSDTSPRGDWRTVARILDSRTLAIPDRKGNKRTDSLHNLLQDNRLSFAALVPGRTGVLHVRGRGSITDDPALLATMALRGTPPHAALLIEVDHAEVTAGPALARSRPWTAAAHLVRGTVPDLMALAGDHLATNLAKAEGSRLARVFQVVMKIPGINRLLRLVMNRAYRSALQKEGYQDVEVGSRRAGRDQRPAAGPAAEHPVREVRIAEVRQETPSTITLALEDANDPAPFHFRPGQFFTLITDIDGRPVRRAYSASSAPGTPRLEVTVKQVNGGRFSTHVHRTLRTGDRLSLRGPSGVFHTDPAAAHEVVLIAAGSGVTPMMSMIRTLLAAPATSRITLLYSNRTEPDIIFADELHRLATENPERLSVTHILTQQHGRLDAPGTHSWLTELNPAETARYYLCGPEPLMDTVQGVLTERGVPEAHVHQERYASGADTAGTTTAPQEMVVEDGAHEVGSVVVEPGQTLLDAGLAAGLPMPYSCTVGNCGDCMVKLRTGQVRMNEPNCLTPQQKADGYVLTCVGCPLAKVTLDIAEPS
ncbi:MULTISPECIES: 2Fe-2S iron-sulfur cluster-binding protein [unclassified Crossiella]|uniref:2Fe-2S iron-sulfur cluster-binding protein n=1 Tax=unclassified Crossiella TaxID=2620835 RepID=UPI001FFE4942|nr:MULTISPECIES: 2Fe-2S iron-sulfur cluster-binding protein [unclassified Crossiella]MCK2238899.1 FAD-binding oxidoreductase [Crossiella sp. S99.2]MCK2251531.1 FAD-binding oxidoreductase [Crossiella sp. S99.1]